MTKNPVQIVLGFFVDVTNVSQGIDNIYIENQQFITLLYIAIQCIL